MTFYCKQKGISLNIDQLKQLWFRLSDEGVIDENVRPAIRFAWEKSLALGLNPKEKCYLKKSLDKEEYKKLLDRNKFLLDIAIPLMENVYSLMDAFQFLVVLTDSKGYMLKVIGDQRIQEEVIEPYEYIEELWEGKQSICNSVNIALETNKPIQVIGAEHFHEVHHKWSCAAAPIHGINGEIIACIEISGPVELCHQHTFTLATVVASSIENMFEKMHEQHKLKLTIEGNHDATILLNENFHIIGINQLAKSLLNIIDENYNTYDFKTIVSGVDWKNVEQDTKGKMFYFQNAKVYVDDNFIDCGLHITSSVQDRSKVYILNFKKHAQITKLVNNFSGNTAKYTFSSIYTKNTQMAEVIRLAKKYAKHDGNILIIGESGTGKEMFAQAIHNASRFNSGPFVAINCASLPRDLIESELFGYEKNAFTGASKDGNMGKFELANGGTLFLDEIGEMPLEFQAKLLRAVENRRIRRIGGKEERELNVRIITATNRNLYFETQTGAFRQDLYFRLNVLEIDIPPLFKRTEDIGYCAQKFLAKYNATSPESAKCMAPSFLCALEKYHWPGNVRELQNCIERVFYTSTNITLHEDDFIHIKNLAPSKEVILDKKVKKIPEQNNEAEVLIHNIQTFMGDSKEIAKALAISRATFYRLCKKYNIEPKKIVRQHAVHMQKNQ